MVAVFALEWNKCQRVKKKSRRLVLVEREGVTRRNKHQGRIFFGLNDLNDLKQDTNSNSPTSGEYSFDLDPGDTSFPSLGGR